METRQAWPEASVNEDYPTMDQFLTFLEKRCEALESCRGHLRESHRNKNVAVRSMHVSSSLNCPKCAGPHLLAQCVEFLGLDIETKREFVKSNRLCFNCLRFGHTSARCQSNSRCKTCNTRHHSLVHFDSINSISTNSVPANLQQGSPEAETSTGNSSSFSLQRPSDRLVNNHSLSEAHRLPQTLLPTAVGNVLDSRSIPASAVSPRLWIASILRF